MKDGPGGVFDGGMEVQRSFSVGAISVLRIMRYQENARERACLRIIEQIRAGFADGLHLVTPYHW